MPLPKFPARDGARLEIWTAAPDTARLFRPLDAAGRVCLLGDALAVLHPAGEDVVFRLAAAAKKFLQDGVARGILNGKLGGVLGQVVDVKGDVIAQLLGDHRAGLEPLLNSLNRRFQRFFNSFCTALRANLTKNGWKSASHRWPQ